MPHNEAARRPSSWLISRALLRLPRRLPPAPCRQRTTVCRSRRRAPRSAPGLPTRRSAGGVLTVVRLATVIPNGPANLGLLQVACVLALGLFDVEKNRSEERRVGKEC